MTEAEDSLVKPFEFQGFCLPMVVALMADTPSRALENTAARQALRSKHLPMGRLYVLEDRTVLCGCIGAPAAVLALEGLIAGGSREIILLGFCGALHRRARLLDALIVIEALCDEGTSSHYFPGREEFFPAEAVKQSIEASVCSRGLPFLTGAVVSTDAPFRETQSWRRRYLERGVDGVDMETSAVFALAEFHAVQAASLLVVSDELTDLGHNSGFTHPKMEKTLEAYFGPFLVPGRGREGRSGTTGT